MLRTLLRIGLNRVILHLDDKVKPFFDDNKPLFDQLMALDGDTYRELEGRTTRRIKLGDEAYFIKQHRGVGAREIAKNLFTFRLPVVSARNEWKAIKQLKKLGVNVPEVCAYGVRGRNPAKFESFILMKEIAPAVSLEELTAEWKEASPDPAYKRKLLRMVADMTRIMHANGINHRDLYLCHFLLQATNGEIKLSVIDLHRAQIRAHVPIRWIIKDLAGLYFSSMDAGLTRNDYYRFIKQYSGKPLRKVLRNKQRRKLWLRVQERGEQMYRDHAQ